MQSIHPLAVVSPRAELGSNVKIGPFSVVEPGARVGDDCILEARVVIKAGTTLGSSNHVYEGCVIGGAPQHVHMPEQMGDVVIGAHNTIRENVTIHRAMHQGAATTIGDRNLLMVNVHIAHDCRVGHQAIFANNVMLAGHVVVDDRAYLSGAVAVHQFCRIGRLAMVGGQAHVNKDIPPFVTIDGDTTYVVGLNLVGLRRNGFTAADIQQLKAAYRTIYRSGLPWNEMLVRLRAEFPDGPARAFHEFFAGGTRGFIQERRLPPRTTLKLRETPTEEEHLHRKAG